MIRKPACLVLWITGLLAWLLSGCAPAPSFSPTLPALTQTAAPAALPSMPPVAPSMTVSPSAPIAACPPAAVQDYLDTAYVLADEMALDAKKAQALGTLSDLDLAALRQQAKVRIQRLGQLQPPACLQPAHDSLSRSFHLMQTSLEQIASSDIPAASQSLKNAYAALADAAVLISSVIYKQ